MKRTAWLPAAALSFLLLALLDPVFASEQPPSGTRAIGWEDIYGWKSLGARFAAALDRDGKPAAIYDLSYPELFGRVFLGSIGSKRMDIATILQAMRDARKALEGNKLELADQAIEILEHQRLIGDSEGLQPEKWWKDIPWKNPDTASNPAGPSRFRLSEIDFEKASGNAKKFRKKLEKFREAFGAVHEGDTDPFQQFEYSLNPDGSFDLFWNIEQGRGVSRPPKIADMTSAADRLIWAMKWDALEGALGALLDAIPIPGVAAVLSTAIDRFSHFRKLLVHAHQDMALEMLRAAEEGDAVSPFSVMSEGERNSAIRSILLGQTSLPWAWLWIFQRPLNNWHKRSEHAAQCALQSHDWMLSNGIAFVSLNPRFDTGESRDGGRWLFLSSRTCAEGETGPYATIDYRNPDHERSRRQWVELLTASVVFGTQFIPYPGAGALLRYAYKSLIEDPMDVSKRWDARLIAHLDERASTGENWSTELSILGRQAINPFEPAHATTLDLIRTRKEALGIPFTSP